MEEFYKYTGWFFAIIVGGIGGIGGVRLLINHLVQAKVNSYFNTKLEDHKKDLAVLTENAKYDISKKLYDFEAYASKKHAVYPELYGLAFETWSELLRFTHTFDIGFLQIEEKLDKNAVLSYVNDKFHPIEIKLTNTYKYFYTNELYLSKTAAIAYKETLDGLQKCKNKIARSILGKIYKTNWPAHGVELIDIDEKCLRDARDTLDALKEVVYKELSYTHFEESKKKEEALS